MSPDPRREPGNFPYSGLGFLLVGFVLIGFSIWQTISISIGADGDIEFAVEQTIGDVKAKANAVFKEFDDRIVAIEEQLGLSGQIASADISATVAENRSYTVLVFYRARNSAVAEEITQSLLGAGYASSRTETTLGEARTQHPQNTAWIVWREQAQSKLGDIEKLVSQSAAGSDIKIVKSTEPSDLRNGDIQILLF